MASDDVSQRLQTIRDAGLFRSLKTVAGPQETRVELDGRDVLLLCSNNYLGLANDERVKAAAAEAALTYGASAGASRSVSGTMSIQIALEESLASFKEAEAALLFGSGYLANIGVIGALAPEGVVLSDELNHASIVDGCRLAGAATVVYPHRDVAQLEAELARYAGAPLAIVTDSVFSMDGDVAPLAEIAALATRFGAKLIVDEAHGTGCLGPGGRGALAAAGVKADAIVGTLGKALGSYGAYVACSGEIRELLINCARSFIFATAPAPPSVAAAQAALDVLIDEPGLVDRLQANASLLRAELAAGGLDVRSETQILPLVIGAADATVAIAEQALRDGVFAQAIRPPTVPPGSSRLRLTVMATHTDDDIREAADMLVRAVSAGL
ncbi:MAG TPA: 8-amino-7-oxononanoate synthase [Baekduia sp.]|nr:8-amino-7-oxononanoate synthase [Baekduia sp.]